jgi:hypothetical protein
MATERVSIRISAEGGEQVKAEFVDVARAGSRALNQIDRSARVSGGGLQNLGFQVQDFAVQVGAGTSASQALAQQLPQLLSGFGLLGVAIGTATAVLIPISRALFSTGEEAQSASQAVSQLGKNLDMYEAFAVTAAMSTEELTAKFGEFAGQVRGFSDYLAGVALGQTFDGLLSTVTALKAPLQEVQDRFAGLAFAKDQLARISNDDAYGLFTARSMVEAAQESLDAAGSALGLTAEQALVLASSIEAVGRAEGVREIATAASEALAVIKSLVPAGQELPAPLRESAFALGEMAKKAGEVSTETGTAADAIAAMNGNLADAYGLYASLRSQAAALTQENINAAMAASSLAYGKIQNTGDSGPDQAARDAIANRPNPFGRIASGAGGIARSSGGGIGPGDAEREAARIYDETRTAAERYAIELEQLNEKTKDATSATERLNDAFAGTFESIITGSSSASEALSALFSNLASQLASSAFDDLNTGLFGSGGIGGLLSGFFGGGKAGGGPVRAGVSYMVGENGPEMVTMGGNGYVTNTAALRSAVRGGGGPVITINAQGAVEGTAAMIARAIREATPGIVRQSVAASREASARGR